MTLHRERSESPGSGPPDLEELDSLLAELSEAAASPAPPAEFAAILLRSACRAARAKAAALWAPNPAGEWREELRVGTFRGEAGRRAAAVRRSAESGTPRLSGEPPGLADDRTLVAPMNGRVLELAVGPDAGGDGPLLLEVARSFAEVGGDYFGRKDTESLRAALARTRQLDAFTRSIHRSVGLGPTAFAVATDGRPVVPCDRLSAFDRAGRVLAVSGVERPDRRAAAVRRLEGLAKAALRSDVRHWRCRGDRVEGVPQAPLAAAPAPAATSILAGEWREYLGLVPGASVDIAVLTDRFAGTGTAEPIGALVAEWLGDPPDGAVDRFAAVADRSAQALGNALDATPGAVEAAVGATLAPLTPRHLPKTAVAAAALAACAAALVLVPAEFVVPARGKLVPERTREVFAPADGIVRTLPVRHGDRVTRGQVLLTLSGPLLELERERVAGELAAARERLRAAQAERATGGPGPDRAEARSSQLAAEEREFAERVAGLERQLAILKGQIDELTVRSPIDGVVLTWEADERFENRPVRRGQRLLTVADPAGDWRLDLRVPDRGTAHLLEARRTLGPGLPIDYRLATAPQRTYHAALADVAYSTEPDDEGRPALRASARIDRAEAPAPRPGATVVANVRCGRKPLGYVWFHELYEALLTHVFF